jgi:hypothetical protein
MHDHGSAPGLFGLLPAIHGSLTTRVGAGKEARAVLQPAWEASRRTDKRAHQVLSMPHALARKAIEMFGRDVIPNFAQLQRAVAEQRPDTRRPIRKRREREITGR